MLKAKERDIVKAILSKKGILLPVSIYNTEAILKLNHVLNNVGTPIAASHFFEKMADNLDEVVNFRNVQDMLLEVKSIRENLKDKKDNIHCTMDGNKKIAKFFREKTSLRVLESLQLLGLYYSICSKLTKLHNIKDKEIAATLLLYTYVVIFELIMHEVSHRLKMYFPKFSDEDKGINKDRFTVKKLNSTFKEFGIISTKEDTIFNLQNKLRNKAAHAQVFYDPDLDMFICLDGTTWGWEDFLREISCLMSFMEDLIDIQTQDNGNATMLERELEGELRKISKMLRGIERGHLKKTYQAYVYKLKKEESDS